MRVLGSVALVSLLALTSAAGAVVPRGNAPVVAETLTAMPGARVDKPLRVQRNVKSSPPATAAWQKLSATGSWRGVWDRATGVPSRIWGSGIAAPGAIASPAIAARIARAALAEHIDLLAPGASPDDFELVSNTFDGNIRSVGFIQKHGGRVVVGGQVSFRFKRDRLFVIGSEALPNISLPWQPRARMSAVQLREHAGASLRSELALPHAAVTPPGTEVVLPLIGEDAVLGYRLAVPVTIDGGAEGRYVAYSDPSTGETLAVRQMNLFASGTVLYRSFDRYPGRPQLDRPAPRAHVSLNGVPQTSSTAGEVSWPDSTTQTVLTAVVGDLVAVTNKASGGALAAAQLALAPSSEALWDASTVPEEDAQVQTYLAVNVAKDFARTLDPNMPTLNEQLVANVNIGQDCNAFFDGKTINFFRASPQCQNTGLVQDVVYHEYGHAVHQEEIVAGVGAFDGAMSEGAADFFAAQITGDPKMGRGFFYDERPLRDLDPDGRENSWPRDLGEIHKTGIIYGGTFWDLRTALIQELGVAEGTALTQRLFIGTLRRSVSIPTSLIEALATDDDDGDLSNGTPHECAIRNAYGRHGLRTASGTIDAPAQLSQPAAAATVRIELVGLAERCTGDDLAGVELVWKPFGTTGPVAGSAQAVQTAPTKFSAQLPLANNDKVLYQARVVFKDGSQLMLPDNLADPFYELYVGNTVPLYCTSFEDGDPLSMGWTTGTMDGSGSPWAWGSPTKGSTDPHAAFSGTHALLQVLNGDYAPSSSSYVRLPPIDIGTWSDVHLQYRRWLAVEDSHFDKARVTVGGKEAWINYTQNAGDSSSTHHIDREWRFQDVVVSGYQPGHTLNIAWALTSDEGLHFGGWALDDVCVVANVNGVCGDGVVTAHEDCDDGAANADLPNACRTWCQAAACGDHIIDDGEECDDGPDGTGECTMTCEEVAPPDLGGCCSAARGAGGAWALSALVLGLVLRRRRPARRGGR